jgi:hypothetical protein
LHSTQECEKCCLAGLRVRKRYEPVGYPPGAGRAGREGREPQLHEPDGWRSCAKNRVVQTEREFVCPSGQVVSASILSVRGCQHLQVFVVKVEHGLCEPPFSSWHVLPLLSHTVCNQT